MDKIVDYINKEISRRGTTQRHLCEVTGVSKTRMSLFLTNQGGFHPTDLIRLMIALDFKITAPDGSPVSIPLEQKQ